MVTSIYGIYDAGLQLLSLFELVAFTWLSFAALGG